MVTAVFCLYCSGQGQSSCAVCGYVPPAQSSAAVEDLREFAFSARLGKGQSHVNTNQRCGGGVRVVRRKIGGN